jgi:hypothetical protein
MVARTEGKSIPQRKSTPDDRQNGDIERSDCDRE